MRKENEARRKQKDKETVAEYAQQEGKPEAEIVEELLDELESGENSRVSHSLPPHPEKFKKQT